MDSSPLKYPGVRVDAALMESRLFSWPVFRRICLAVGALLVVLAGVLLSPLYKTPIGTAMGVVVLTVSTAFVIVGGLLRLPHTKGLADRPFTVLGLISYSSGFAANAALMAYPVVTGHDTPMPSPADGFFFLGYLFGLLGLLRISLGKSLLVRLRFVLDGSIVAASVLFISWPLVVKSTVASTHAPAAATATQLTYLMFDVVMITSTLLAVSYRRRSAGTRVLIYAAGAVLEASGDLFAFFTNTFATATPHPLALLGWTSAALVFGVAMLYPERTVEADAPEMNYLYVALPYVPMAGAAAIAVWEWLSGGQFGSFMIAMGMAAIAATMGRQLLSLLENVRLRRALAASLTELSAREVELDHLAHHDALTQLPNRRSLAKHIEALEEADASAAILLLDLDNFKGVNDAMGHDAGDELLVVIARRLRNGVRGNDVVARLGGDEFAVLLRGASEARALEIGERLSRCIGDPVRIGTNTISPSASIGVALRVPGMPFADLMRFADMARYERKRQGKRGVAVFRPEMEADALRALVTPS